MMNRAKLLAFLVILACPTPARAEEIVIPVPRDWSGFHVGLNAGYALGEHAQESSAGNSDGHRLDGGLAGLQLGHDWYAGDILIGAEADFQFADIAGEFATEEGGWSCMPGNEGIGCASQVDWFGTARLRAGYPAGSVLAYLTGGLAYGSLASEFKDEGPDWQVEDVVLGWSAGAGLEIAHSATMSTRIEYLYTDLGATLRKGDYDFGASAGFSSLRVGLNYAFGAAAAGRLIAEDAAAAEPRGWGGFRAGITGGYARGDQVMSDEFGGSSGEQRLAGAATGVLAGYDLQFGPLVIGAAADFQFANLEGLFNSGEKWSCLDSGCRTTVDWFATARLRAGLASDRLLAYVTGGGATAAIASDIIELGADWRIRDRQLGWAAGAGIEYALSERVSAEAQYLWIDLGTTPASGIDDSEVSAEFGLTRLGLNYAF
ncbi:MAG: outer membrane protein [Aestuariivirga sp.]